jgi:hypothetical protein
VAEEDPTQVHDVVLDADVMGTRCGLMHMLMLVLMPAHDSRSVYQWRWHPVGSPSHEQQWMTGQVKMARGRLCILLQRPALQPERVHKLGLLG